MNVAEICSELVQINSENPPGKTTGAVGYIAEILGSLGFSYNTTDDGSGRCNIFTEYRDRPLLLMGHLDVVPAIRDGWKKDPFSGEISGGFVHGRGATDMKGGCAALLCAVSDLIDEGIAPPCNLCFVCDEENGGDAGVKSLLKKKFIDPCDCIIAEPTPHLNPAIGQKGLFRAKVGFTGKPGHGSLYPEVGESAIMDSVGFLSFLKNLNEREFVGDKSLEEIIERSSHVFSELFGIENADQVLKKITYNPGLICGGERVNIVAQKCSLDFEMRIPWGCNIKALKKEIYDNNPSAEIVPQEYCGPGYTDPETKLVKIACSEIGDIYGQESYPIVQWAASDARYLREGGFNVIEYGPGDIRTIHGIDEKVSIENLKKSVEIYKKILMRYNE